MGSLKFDETEALIGEIAEVAFVENLPVKRFYGSLDEFEDFIVFGEKNKLVPEMKKIVLLEQTDGNHQGRFRVISRIQSYKPYNK